MEISKKKRGCQLRYLWMLTSLIVCDVLTPTTSVVIMPIEQRNVNKMSAMTAFQ